MAERRTAVAGGESGRYVYRARGVCPSEIHLRIREGFLEEVRFEGGGCPGNARLVSRLLSGRPLHALPDLLEGIPCRDGTSCPDQLLRALRAVQEGALCAARSFLICEDPEPKGRVGLVGHLGGDADALKGILAHMRAEGVEAVCCLGDQTGALGDSGAVLERLRQEKALAVLGEGDWRRVQSSPSGLWAPLEPEDRDYLLGLPQVAVFHLADRKALGFFGAYLQALPGFSDFEPYALEMNMVCNLTRFLQDETVFPALASMTPQLEAQIVLFSQPRRWGHWRIGNVDFISVGPARSRGGVAWGALEARGGGVELEVREHGHPFARRQGG